MELSDYATAMAAAQRLVPDYNQTRMTGLAVQAQQQQNQRVERNADQENAFQAAVNALPPTAGATDYANIMVRHPEHAEQIKGAWNMVDRQQQVQEFSTMAQMWAALESKRPDLAALQIKRRLDAQRNGGPASIDGPEDAEDRDAYEALSSGDPERIAGVKRHLGVMLASIGGSDKFAANYNAIQKADDGYTLSEGGMRFDSDNNLVAAAPYKPQAMHLRDGDRDTILEYTPGMPGATAGQGARPALASRSAVMTTRGTANNNPGNLEASAFSQAQPGYIGSDGRFAMFETPEQGVAAQERLLANSYFGKGINTIDGIVAKYAPASDGNDVRAYSAFLSKRSGIPADKPVTTAMGQKAVAAAMRAFESRYEEAEVPALRVIAQGAPKPGYRVMAPAEVAGMRGLDPGRAYQMSPQGRISAVPGVVASKRTIGGSRSSGGAKAPSTLAGVMAPIFQKVAQGGTLSSGEQQALAMYNTRRSRSGGSGRGGAASSTAAPAGIPEGTTATGPGGVKMVRRSGKWVRM